jgi:hypothetical protein
MSSYISSILGLRRNSSISSTSSVTSTVPPPLPLRRVSSPPPLPPIDQKHDDDDLDRLPSQPPSIWNEPSIAASENTYFDIDNINNNNAASIPEWFVPPLPPPLVALRVEPLVIPTWRLYITDFFNLLSSYYTTGTNADSKHAKIYPYFSSDDNLVFKSVDDDDDDNDDDAIRHPAVTSPAFDSWFVHSCCTKYCYAVEFAWSLVVGIDPTRRKPVTYASLILQSRVIRARFAHLVCYVLRDIDLENSKWRFSNPNNLPNILTLSKPEIRLHESRKKNLLHLFKGDYWMSSMKKDDDDNDDNKSPSHQELVALYQRIPDRTTIESYEDNSNNYYHSYLHRLAYHSLTVGSLLTNAHPAFVSDEFEALQKLEQRLKVVYGYHTLGRHALDYTLIFNNALTRITLAAIIGIRFRIRRRQNALEHTPKSMFARFQHSLYSLELNLCQQYITLQRSSSSFASYTRP